VVQAAVSRLVNSPGRWLQRRAALRLGIEPAYETAHLTVCGVSVTSTSSQAGGPVLNEANLRSSLADWQNRKPGRRLSTIKRNAHPPFSSNEKCLHLVHHRYLTAFVSVHSHQPRAASPRRSIACLSVHNRLRVREEGSLCGFTNGIEKQSHRALNRRRVHPWYKGHACAAALASDPLLLGSSSTLVPQRLSARRAPCLNSIVHICILFLTRWFSSLSRIRCGVSPVCRSLTSTAY